MPDRLVSRSIIDPEVASFRTMSSSSAPVDVATCRAPRGSSWARPSSGVRRKVVLSYTGRRTNPPSVVGVEVRLLSRTRHEHIRCPSCSSGSSGSRSPGAGPPSPDFDSPARRLGHLAVHDHRGTTDGPDGKCYGTGVVEVLCGGLRGSDARWKVLHVLPAQRVVALE